MATTWPGPYSAAPRHPPNRYLRGSSAPPAVAIFPGAGRSGGLRTTGTNANVQRLFWHSGANPDGVIEWATNSFQTVFGWPNAFYTLDAALAARAEFLAKDLDVNVFGLGLHRDDTERFLSEAKPEGKKPGCSQAGETGIYECVKRSPESLPGESTWASNFWQ